MKCENCGYELHDNDLFCTNCGKQVPIKDLNFKTQPAPTTKNPKPIQTEKNGGVTESIFSIILSVLGVCCLVGSLYFIFWGIETKLDGFLIAAIASPDIILGIVLLALADISRKIEILLKRSLPNDAY